MELRSKNLLKYLIGTFLFIPITIAIVTIAYIFIQSRDKSNMDKPKEGNGAIEPPTHELPTLTELSLSPTDTFLVRESDYDKIERAHPFNGSNTACAHGGAHIHFTNEDAPYDIEIISPVDGYISFIIDCFTLTEDDKFDLGLAVGEDDNGDIISLIMSMEPFAGEVCAQNPNFFRERLKVDVGDEVKKGDILFTFPKPDRKDSAAHIHFNLVRQASNTIGGEGYCPNIFDSEVVQSFGQMYGQETCSGELYKHATFCNQPATGESLFTN